MFNYKELTKHLSESVAAILTSTGSYTSSQSPLKMYHDETARKAMNYEGVLRNPVILIHGFLGSSLVDIDSGINLWGDFDIKETINIAPAKMHKLAHPMQLNKPLTELPRTVSAERLLENINIQVMGLPLKLPAYKDMVDILIRGGFQPSHHPMGKNKNFNSLFLFPYDWRCDLQQSVRKLNDYIRKKRKYIQKQYLELYGLKDYDVQFDIVAHSMGGLISRYLLRYGDQDLPEDGSMPELNWDGAKVIDRLIMVGTPNAGYLDTMLELLYGSPLQPYPPAVLGTLPSYYQMLPAPETKSFNFKGDPSDQNIDIFNPELWKRMKWGLANPANDEIFKLIIPDIKTKEKRAETALDHLSKCLARAKQFIQAMSIHADAPDDVSMHIVCGNGIKTTKRAEIDKQTGKVEVAEFATGDGKVLTSSALWDERASGKRDSHFMTSPIDWTSIMLLRTAHMGITKAQGFEDNLLFLLTMKESIKQQKFLKQEL